MNTKQENLVKRCGTTLLMALSLCLPSMAWAQNMIKSIQAGQQAGAEILRIEFDQALKELPRGFTIQAPARIAIDLPGVGNALGRNNIEINQGNVRSASVAQSADRTRLVLNLRNASNYRAELQDKALLLILEPSSVEVQAKVETQHFSPSQNNSPIDLKEIDFRRGADGAGRVVIALPNPQVGVDIQQQGQFLVVEVLRSAIPAALRKRMDVRDFGTPVQFVTVAQQGDKVRLQVDAKGNWEHSAYQSDSQFVLEIRPVRQDSNKLTQGPGFSGEKVSFNFQNIEVRALLQVIADFTQFNVVTSDSVTGSITLRLKDVPWDQALEIILQAKGLGLRKTGDVLWIAPKEELAAKEKLEYESLAAKAQLEPTRTQAFQLNYIKAEDVVKVLSGAGSAGSSGTGAAQGARVLSPRGSVNPEPRTNQVFVTDIPAKLEEIQGLVQRIDVPIRQVLIEARIVEADDKFGRSLGVKLGATDMRGLQGGIPGYSVGGNNYLSFGGNYAASGYQTNQSPQVDFTNSQFINLPATAINSVGAATIAATLFSATANRFLNLELSALEADGKGKIVSSPRVITADQVKALIEQGEEIPYLGSAQNGATAVTFKKAVLKLEVTPQITPEGNVILDVDVNKDSRGVLTPAGFAINNKHVKTQVLVENGGTVVIGGIFTLEEIDNINKVPLLGDIPYMGALFRNKSRIANKTELLIFLTPKVVSERASLR
ncbi:type IV pilus secretin PilQ [Inhella proteolytica]|uniref:Type IV pilus biogenesis and competence protein PilQ n=1 Tax=Inhella proteolytica TaxID=2795029 RepID=A0A931J1W2_9BURK|nr:type IV pilus secretin PilQ [Inhella proteolytica]MBH9576014.1 type IV pilus secretin PilQ [Inhella proteolytica]